MRASRKRWIAFSVGVLFTILNTVFTGMYGALVFWSAFFFMYYSLKVNTSILRKALLFLVGAVAVLLIQSIKADYRDATWGDNYERNYNFSFFVELITDRIQNPEKLIDNEALFKISIRANQGALIAGVIKYIPAKQPYADGTTINRAVAGAIVPRVIWPSKPQTGGRDNIQRFLGEETSETSYNISPLGEGYGNYGRYGLLLFMFVYGAFFKLVFQKVLDLAHRRPSLVLWIPLLFLGAVRVETDLLSTFGSLFKGVLFLVIVFALFDKVLKVKL